MLFVLYCTLFHFSVNERAVQDSCYSLPFKYFQQNVVKTFSTFETFLFAAGHIGKGGGGG